MKETILSKLQFLEKNYRYKALFLFLLRAETYTTSNELALQLHVTSRTIKNDIKVLKESLALIQIVIDSKRSEGYKLQIADEAVSTLVKEHFKIYQPKTIDTEFDSRVQYITRRLLVAKGSVKVATLQQELYVSESNMLSKELHTVRKFLENYQLEIITKPYYGMYIEGKPYLKTICIMRMFQFFNPALFPVENLKEYQELFACDSSEYTLIRETFIRTITTSRIVFSDIHAERFILYLLYFKNQPIDALELPLIDFRYELTDEFRLVSETVEKINCQIQGFTLSKEVICFLTYIAIMSSDLYRFKDCTRENYDTLLVLAEDLRGYIFRFFSKYLQINLFDDFTSLKDLLKIMIPISLKVALQISDDIDFGYYDLEKMKSKPIISHGTKLLANAIMKDYYYQLSNREQYLIFNAILGAIDRIKLSHTQLKLAIVAIDGRLSTQQLKFNIQHYFSEFIAKIDTKVLYELQSMDTLDYDYYLCMEYGKNMNIPYRPIYYASDAMIQSEYVESLRNVFFEAYKYNEILPAIEYIEIHKNYKFKDFPTSKYIPNDETYQCIPIGKRKEVLLYFNFQSKQNNFKILYLKEDNDVLLSGVKKILIIDLLIEKNAQKLKMILNIMDGIAEETEILKAIVWKKEASYRYFLNR